MRSQGGRTYDASVQFVVYPKNSDGKTADVVGWHQPVVSKSGVYNGAWGPSASYLVEGLNAIGQKVGDFLHDKGFAGAAGIDVFVSEGPKGNDGLPSDVHMYAVDGNLRTPGTLPALKLRQILEQVYEKQFASTTTDNFYLPEGTTLEWVWAVAQQPKFKWDHETACGVVLHLTGLVESHHKIGFSCFAPADEKSIDNPFGPAVDLETQFKKALWQTA